MSSTKPNEKQPARPSAIHSSQHHKKHKSEQDEKLNTPSVDDIQRLNQHKAKAIAATLLERHERLQKEQSDLKQLRLEFASMENKLSVDVETLRHLIAICRITRATSSGRRSNTRRVRHSWTKCENDATT